MMNSVIARQSATNWRLLKQIYLQGAKYPSPPEPTHLDNADQSIRQYAESLLIQMENLYRHSVAELEERIHHSMEFFTQRIAALEEEVNSLREINKAMLKVEPRSDPDEMAQLPEDEEEAGKPSPFIHIEEEEEESLLQPETVQKDSLILNSQRGTVRREVGKSTVNVRRLFEDESAARMKYQYSEAMRPLSTKESAYFEKDTREEMETLRSFIERAHGITLERNAYLPEVAVTVRNIEIEPSKNEALHLHNENNALRQQISHFQIQLQQAQDELEKVRHLLLRGLEEQDCGPYAACL